MVRRGPRPVHRHRGRRERPEGGARAVPGVRAEGRRGVRILHGDRAQGGAHQCLKARVQRRQHTGAHQAEPAGVHGVQGHGHDPL